MTLQLRYLGVAEAVAADGRGVFHVLGWDPAVFTFSEFPVTWPLAIVGLFEADALVDESIQPGTPLTIALAFRDPSGSPLMVQQQTIPVGVRQHEDIPHRVQFIGQVGVTFAGAGDYTCEMSLSIPGQPEVQAQRTVYVRGAATSAARR